MNVASGSGETAPHEANRCVRVALADRRPLLASVGGAPRPLTEISSDGTPPDKAVIHDRAELSATVLPTASLVASAVVPLGSGWASPCTRLDGSLCNRMGSRIGGSIVSLDMLRAKYAQMLDTLAASCSASVQFATSASASPASLSNCIRALPQDALAQHCLALHSIVLDAVGGIVQHPTTPPTSGCFDVMSPDATAVLVPSSCSSRGPAALGEVNWAPNDNAAPLASSAHRVDLLQHSVSAMSMVAEPVRTTTEARKSYDDDGSKMINDYVVLDDIGRGRFGKVKLAFDTRLCRMVAIKVVRKPAGWDSIALQASSDDRRSSLLNGKMEQFHALQREIAVMKKLRHKNIVSLYEVIDDPEAEKLYLVMQYINNGAVGQIHAEHYTCSTIPANELLHLAQQLFAGLQYLHARGIVHRDIKPENILVSADGDAYLADFGVSEAFERAAASDVMPQDPMDHVGVEGYRGTTMFMAPELVGGAAAVNGRSVDAWAMGVTLYALLVGQLPFTSPQAIADPHLPDWAPVPPLWRPLLEGLLHRDVNLRLTAADARQLVKTMGTPHTPAKRTSDEDDEGVLSDDASSPSALATLPAVPSRLGGVASLDVINAITPMARRPSHVMRTAPSQASMQHEASKSPRQSGSGARTAHMPTTAPLCFSVNGKHCYGDAQEPSPVPQAVDDLRAIAAAATTLGADLVHARSALSHWLGRPAAASPVDVALFHLAERDGHCRLVAGGEVTTTTASQKETSKCHRRLQQLLDEQHRLETTRLLIPRGVLSPPKDAYAL